MFGGNTSATGAAGDGYFLFFSMEVSPFIGAYVIYSSGVFGNRYSSPAILPSGSVTGAPGGNAITSATYSTITDVIRYSSAAYPWSGAGFGTRYANPSPTINTVPHAVAVNPRISIESGVAFTSVAIGYNNPSPYVNVYRWVYGSGYSFKWSDPASPPVGAIYGASFNPVYSVLGLSASGSRPVEFYGFSNLSGFSGKFTAPPGMTPNSLGVAFNSTGNAVAVTSLSNPYVSAFPWIDSVGFGTQYSNPSTPLPSAQFSVVFNPTNTAIALVGNTAPYITVYAWSNTTGFGTKYADPATPIPASATTVAFSPDNKLLAIGHSNSPYLTVYNWSDSTGFGAKVENPLVLPEGTVNGVSFGPAI